MGKRADRSGAVLGIDVGCSAVRRSSAVCRLDWTGGAVRWRIERFRATEPERAETIRRVAGAGPFAAVAIDGPLAPGFEKIDRYRSCERLLTRRLWRAIGKPGQSSTPVGRLLNFHASACARIARDQLDVMAADHPEAIGGRAIVEAFPSAFLGLLIAGPERLGATRANRSDLFFSYLAATAGFEWLLTTLLPGRALAVPPATLTDHDERAALICALTALALAVGLYTAVGDAADGWIILPPWPLIDPSRRAELAGNDAEDATGVVRHHD